MGGKPNPGTKADQRLASNKGKSNPTKSAPKSVGKNSMKSMPGIVRKGK